MADGLVVGLGLGIVLYVWVVLTQVLLTTLAKHRRPDVTDPPPPATVRGRLEVASNTDD